MSIATTIQARRLQQAGFGLILLSSLEGFVIPLLKVQELAVATHLLAIMEGLVLVAAGLVWPSLKLRDPLKRLAFWSSVYSAAAIISAYGAAAALGVGVRAVTLPGSPLATLPPGGPIGELVVTLLAYSSGPGVVLSLVLILAGLRERRDDV